MSYNDNYSLIAYGQMIEDTARLTPWREALRRHVTADSVVLDIGCGPGVMSFLACQFGARKVYAVEPDSSIEVAKLCAAQIPGGERIEWIQGLSTEIDLPEFADIVVGDLHGTMSFYTHNIASLADARRRHLRPGGVLLPSRDMLYAVPASAPWEIEQVESPWRRNTLGLDLSAAMPWLINGWWRARTKEIEAGQLLADPMQWGTVDYRTDEETRCVERTLEWTFANPGRLDGLFVWFDGEVDDGLGFSNSPLLPELVYGRAFFPLERSIDVLQGEHMHTRLSARRVQGDWIIRWESTIKDSRGQIKAAFKQSTFHLLSGVQDNLRKSEVDHQPQLGEAGRIQLAILANMDGQSSLAEIAMEMQRQYPTKFRDFDRALAEVARCSRQFSQGKAGQL